MRMITIGFSCRKAFVTAIMITLRSPITDCNPRDVRNRPSHKILFLLLFLYPIGLDNFNFNFKRLYSTQIYKGKAKTCVLHSNVWRLLLRYMHTACIRATKKIIGWMTFILHTITYDQRNQTSYTDAQNLSQWRTVWIMGHEWFDVKRKYKGSGKSNSVQYKIFKPICRLYEIAGACYWAKMSR